LIEEQYDGYRCQKTLDEPRFHDDGRLVDAFFLKKMMERCDQEEFLFEIFFPENLEKARCQVYDKEQKEYDKGKKNPCPHVEEVEQRSYKSSQSERSAIAHEDLGGMDVVKHECH